MITNGDFSNGTNDWELQLSDGAVATGVVDAGTEDYYLKITNPGLYSSSIQLVQEDINLVQGNTYVLEFDAHATLPRLIYPKISSFFEPFTDYSLIGSCYTAIADKHYEYEFKMEEPSDYAAKLAFEFGGSMPWIVIDNISLKMLDTNVEQRETNITPVNFALVGNYPNPFNSSTKICFCVPHRSNVRLIIYDLLGRIVHEKHFNNLSAGKYNFHFSESTLSSGIYFCVMEAHSPFNAGEFKDIIKIMHVR